MSSTRPTAYLVIAFSLLASSLQATPRAWVWDLSPLYPDRGAWERERNEVLEEIERIPELRGTLGQSAVALATGLDRLSALRTRGTRLALYGILRSEAEPESAEAAELSDAGTDLEARVESAIAFAWPEVLAIGTGSLHRWLEQEPRLAPHRIRLLRLLSEAAHRRSAETEAALAAAARWPLVATEVWQRVVSGPLGWPRPAEPGGTPVEATRPAFLSARTSLDAWRRREVTRAHLGRLRDFESLFGLLLTRRMDADLALARQRGFASGIDALWFLRDGMPAGSAQRMSRFTLDHLQPLRRYVALRTRAAGLVDARYDDLNAPIRRSEPLPLEIAIARARTSLSALGPKYLARLDERLRQPWFQFVHAPGRARAYGIYPPVGGAPPYFIQSFDGSHDGARRLAGGLLLQMAFADWPADRPFDSRDDPPTWANGLIYAGDLLFDEDALAAARSPDERVVALVQALDLIANHFYRWALVTALDLEVERRLEAGEPPSGAEISGLYASLLRRAYGEATIGDEWAMEWATFAVPFLSYEHEFWPSALAAACALLERFREGDASARALLAEGRYGRSDSDRSWGLLAEAGVDFGSDEPYRAVERRMTRLLDELEQALRERDAPARR